MGGRKEGRLPDKTNRGYAQSHALYSSSAGTGSATGGARPHCLVSVTAKAQAQSPHHMQGTRQNEPNASLASQHRHRQCGVQPQQIHSLSGRRWLRPPTSMDTSTSNSTRTARAPTTQRTLLNHRRRRGRPERQIDRLQKGRRRGQRRAHAGADRQLLSCPRATEEIKSRIPREAQKETNSRRQRPQHMMHPRPRTKSNVGQHGNPDAPCVRRVDAPIS